MRNNISVLLLSALAFFHLTKAQLCPDENRKHGKGDCKESFKPSDCYVGCGMKNDLLFLILFQNVSFFCKTIKYPNFDK